MSAVVSFPQGVDEEKATEAARQFFRGGVWQITMIMSLPDIPTPKISMCMLSWTGSRAMMESKYGINKDDIQDDADALRRESRLSKGIELDASPRWARGLEAERQPGLRRLRASSGEAAKPRR